VILTAGTPAPKKEPPRGEKIAETNHFEFYAEDSYFPVPVDQLKEQGEVIFDYVSGRVGASIDGKIYLSFRKPSAVPCSPRGMTSWPTPMIIIYADENTSNKQLLGVLGHEIGHIIHFYILGNGSIGDAVLTEGLATWASGHYWNEWQGAQSFDERVRLYIDESRFIPLSQRALRIAYQSEDCPIRRDIVYTEWASFVDFLIKRYGMEKLMVLLKTAPPTEFTGTELIERPADYYGVYGQSLDELQAAWLEYLLSGD
jgi:hypothetical protein